MSDLTCRTPRVLLLLALLLSAARLSAAEDGLPAQLQKLDGAVIPKEDERARQFLTMLGDDIRARRREANERETKLWKAINTRADWERYRDVRLQALRTSLGQWPEVPKDLKVQVTRTLDGDGYRIEAIVFQSRPGLIVTANLYMPKEPAKSMPGIVICTSHHNPKTQGELQDMGISWAKQGCLVIVPDNLGHGERRQHPFRTDKDYDGAFKPGRQDYYFRYNSGMQLNLVGESQIGWLAWDLMRCVDVLLAQHGIDKERILLLGSVAGGGDPAAVAGALDPRITAVGPFNFGGPQPETTFPLPTDAEAAFNYAGGGSWESTRNLRLSVRDGFAPWLIVGGVAPRGLIYAHEFAWDRAHDPVWARLEKIYGFYDKPERLSSTNGKGSVKGASGPDNTHCNNIGPVHRAGMYPALNRWFHLEMSPEKETKKRHPSEELLCLTPAVEKQLQPQPIHVLAAALAKERGQAARDRRAALKPEERTAQLRKDWAKLLGDVGPSSMTKATVQSTQKVGPLTVERIVLEVEPRIAVPLLLLLPERTGNARLPMVVGLAQDGKQGFLTQRPEALAELLENGVAVCLPDLRGTGETRPGSDRGRGSSSTSLSSSEQMLGQTLLGDRLRDLRGVLKYLRGRPEVDAARLGLWGESFAPVNAASANLRVPLDAEKLPPQAEPLGGLLALLGAMYEPEVRAVSAQGSLSSCASVLQGPFCWVPHDALVPGALTIGDLADVAAALAPRPVRLEGPVDGLNRRVSSETLEQDYAAAKSAFRAAGVAEKLSLEAEEGAQRRRVAWLRGQLARPGR